MAYIVVEENSGKQVKPGMRILSFKDEIYEFYSFDSPRHAGNTGRVNVKDAETGDIYSYYPQVFGLKIVEI